MPMPEWLLNSLRTKTGLELRSGYGKFLKSRRCPGCGTTVLCGLDDETQGNPAIVDLDTLTTLGEAYALMDGRITYRLHGNTESTLGLWRRDQWNMHHWPIGGEDSSGTVRVVADHRCNNPLPEGFGMYESETV